MENGTVIFDGETNACINRYLTKTKEEIGSKLSSIKNRNGNGKLRFADYKFRNENNEIITEVISGEYLKIEIDFDLYKKVNFQKLIIVLNIQDNFEKSIISYVTDEMGTKFNDPIDNKLIIEIPELLLRGGQYTARLLAMEESTHHAPNDLMQQQLPGRRVRTRPQPSHRHLATPTQEFYESMQTFQ